MAGNDTPVKTELHCSLKIDGAVIDERFIFDINIQADLDQPDMAAITLSNGLDRDGNSGPRYAETLKENAPVEVRLWLQAEGASDSPLVFAGDLVGVEPIYAADQAPRVVVRCLNGLHRLARGKKSRTFLERSDAEIVKQVVEQGYKGLKVDFGDAEPTTKYKHIYQHNQTDLEFLRHRAARIGYEVLVEADNKTLYFRPPSRKKVAEPLEFKKQGGSSLHTFYPRLSTASQVAGVRVRVWDPETKKPIIGVADPKSSILGKRGGDEMSQNILTLDVDIPVYSKEEADGIARSILLDREMSYIVADAMIAGNYELRPGNIVTIKVEDERFAGDYYVTSVAHVYSSNIGNNTGFRTRLKLKRDAQGTRNANDTVMTPVKLGAAIQG